MILSPQVTNVDFLVSIPKLLLYLTPGVPRSFEGERDDIKKRGLPLLNTLIQPVDTKIGLKELCNAPHF